MFSLSSAKIPMTVMKVKLCTTVLDYRSTLIETNLLFRFILNLEPVRFKFENAKYSFN